MAGRYSPAQKQKWDSYYRCLRVFVAREGHAKVPQHHVEDGVRLGQWVSHQRRQRDKLSFRRVRALVSVKDWTWGSPTKSWDEAYELLLQFAKREGHALVRRAHLEDGYKLGSWVHNRRQKRESMSRE